MSNEQMTFDDLVDRADAADKADKTGAEGPGKPIPNVIKKGDLVSVLWVKEQTARATVVWTPGETDDHCWYFRSEDGTLWTQNPWAMEFNGLALVEKTQ